MLFLLDMGCPMDASESESLQADEGWEPVPVTLAIGKGDNIFIVSEAGVLSPWHIPYVYENRNGIDAILFADSPADEGRSNRFAVDVDDGIYVYSLGARSFLQSRNARWREHYIPRFIGLGVFVAACSLLVILWRRSRRARYVGVAAILVGAAVGVVTGGTRATCYIMMPLFSHRDEQAIVQQRQLLDSYHERGIIGDEAHRRATEALNQPNQTPP